MDDHYYLRGAEPFFFNGDGVGCLLVHGFTSSPGEMRWLGQYLHAQGITVHGLRLTGHGTDYRSLAHARWPDWFGDVLDGYHLLRQMCDQVVIVGHSMGGLLALLAGAALPLDGLVVMGSPLIFESRWIGLARIVRHVKHYIDATDRTPLPQLVREEQAQRGEPVLGRIRYDTWSTSALAQMVALSARARASLPEITVPTCLIYSTGDHTAAYASMELIASQIRSKVVEQHTLRVSDHNLMLDVERDAVFQFVWNFIHSLKA